MGFLDAIGGFIKAKSSPPRIEWLYGAPGQSRPFVVGEHYLRLWASDLYLEYDRIGPWGVCPGVQTLVVLRFGDQQVEIPGFIGPGKIALTEAKGRSAIRTERQVMTQALPYRGGVVEVESVLLRLPGENHFKAFTTFLEGVADTLVLGEVAASLNIADKVAGGIADLLSLTEKGRLMLGWMSDFGDQGESALHDGYVALLPQGRLSDDEVASLKVVNGLLHRSTGGSEIRVEGVDFLLLEFERLDHRLDWDEISSIAKPLGRAREYLDNGEDDQARAFFRAAILAVRQTRDLTKADKDAAVAMIQSWIPTPSAQPGPAALRRDPYSVAPEDDNGG